MDMESLEASVLMDMANPRKATTARWQGCEESGRHELAAQAPHN